MAAEVLPSACTVFVDTLSSGLKHVWFVTADTVDASDYLTITLANYGIQTLVGVRSYVHTTSNSIITAELNTTSVTTGVLTVTIAAGTNNDIRVVHIWGY